MSLEELTVYSTNMIGWLNFALIVGVVILVIVIGKLYDRVKKLEKDLDWCLKQVSYEILYDYQHNERDCM